MSSHEESDKFYKWIIDSGRSPSTADKYSSSVKGPLTKWAKSGNIISGSLFEYDTKRSISSIANEIRELDIFKSRNSSGNGMTHHALKAYETYRIETVEHSAAADIISIIEECESTTEREQLVAARMGQGLFRKELISIWGSCSVTGYSLTSLLVASHIKPWRWSSNKERLDPSNGLLLTPNLDKAFDRFLISFASSGNILISPELIELHKIAIDSTMKIKMTSCTQVYMDHHRQYYYEHM